MEKLDIFKEKLDEFGYIKERIGRCDTLESLEKLIEPSTDLYYELLAMFEETLSK